MKKFIVVLVFAYTIALSSCAWAITANMSITGSPGSGKVGKSYSASFGVMFSTSSLLNWSMSGSVPGLSFSGFGASASLSGTPTREGSYSITIRVSSKSGSASKSFTVNISAGGGGGNDEEDNDPIYIPEPEGKKITSYFGDSVFREYLSSNFDKDRNGYLTDAEIAGAESICVSGKDIGYLSGISYLTALKKLDCSNNKISTETFSSEKSNTVLTYLDCSNNQLTKLDLSKYTVLKYLNCKNNKLTEIDISGCMKQEITFECDENVIVIFKNGILINSAIFPDATFREYVIRNFDSNGDGCLSDSEIAAVKVINVKGKGIASLKGIEYLTALNNLNCENNKLTSFDLHKNTALKTLNCGNNQLTGLSLSYNEALTELTCENNKLTYLFSLSTTLTSLNCSNNQLTAMDLSKHTALKYLNCTNNKLSTIDISGCTKQVTQIDRDKGVTVIFSEGIAVDSPSFPDAAFREYVISEFDKNRDGCLSTSEIAAATYIEVTEKGITSLQGIEYFTALISLGCNHNQLTELNVSKNTALYALECSNNQLTALDVSKNTALKSLFCDHNQLTTLDVSKNRTLDALYCAYNKLTALDISKNTVLEDLSCGNNQLTDIYIGSYTHPKSLYCDNNKLTTLDVSKNTALEDLYCSSNQLTALDVSKNKALESLYCSNNQLTALDVSKNVALEVLYCSNNQLKALDVSNNIALMNLVCENNKLTVLDISNCAYLLELVTTGDYSNWLRNLVIDDNVTLNIGVAISSLNFPDSVFREYVSTNFDKDRNGYLSNPEIAAATYIFVSDKGITSLKGVEYFTALKSLFCQNNKLTELDLSRNTTLKSLYCKNNKLTIIYISDSSSEVIISHDSGVKIIKTTIGVPSITTTSLPSGKVGESYSATLSATSDIPITWSASGLPGGLSCSSSGTISGTPASSGTYSVTVTATNTAGSVSKTFTVNIGSSIETSEVAISSLNFPDSVFREYVSTNFDKDRNGYLSSSEIAAATYMYVSYKGITSLKGVEHFTALETLFCSNNGLTELDLSRNTALTFLYCKNNKLTEIYISDRSNLTTFSYDNDVRVIKCEEKKPEFKAHQPDLDGIIVVNFYAYMPEISGVNYNNSYVKFKILNDTKYNPTQEYDPSFTAAGKLGTYYGFRCCVTSVQMADPITATLHYGNGLTVEHTYKLTDYLDKYYSASTTPELLKNVVGAMKDYGHYAQIALAEVNDWTIGKDHLETQAANVYTDSDIEEAREAVEDYAKSWNVGNSGIKSIGYRLALDADTIIELFIRPNDDYNGNVSAYSRGVIGITDTSANIAVKQSDGRYLVQISGIPAHRLDYTNVIRVVTDKGEFDVKVSALSYVNTILNSEKYNDNMKKAVTSLYKYYKAAKAYWENNNQ